MSEERLPTEEEWAAWLLLPETGALRRIARKRREAMRDAWEEGAYLDQPSRHAMCVGACKALQLLEDLSYETAIIAELGEDDGGAGNAGPGE